MPITASWHQNNDHILIYNFHGHWTWDDLYDVLLLGREMMQEVNHEVFVICELTKSSIIPASSVRRLGDIANTRPVNTTQVFLVGEHYLMKTLYAIFQRIYPNLSTNYILVPTLEDALDMINPYLAQSGAQT